jgi:hypothetical protein
VTIWFTIAFMAILVLMTGIAFWVALFVPEKERSERAVKLFKIAFPATFGAGGLVLLLLRLLEAGLL